MKVEEFMTRDVRVCGKDDVLNRAAQLMWESDCGCIPVVENDSRVAGIVTDRDICMAAYTRGVNLHQMRVSDAMSRGVFACRPTDELAEVHEKMRANRVRRLPVINDDGTLIGIVSLNDLARASRAASAKSQLAATLAAICAPHAAGIGRQERAPQEQRRKRTRRGQIHQPGPST